jgi:hypothetical protein
LVLVALFAASGAAARYCMVAHHSSSDGTVAQVIHTDLTHHAHAFDQGAHGHHSHTGSTEEYGATDTVPVVADAAACAQCCSTCTPVTAVVRDGAAEAAFTASPAVFFCRPDHCSKTIILVDPGIPKRIV